MLAETLEVSEQINFVGNLPHDRVLEHMRECLFFALASRAEGLPLVLAEAMACGKAVVATNVDGVPEIVQDGCTGILVEPDDPHALAEALVKLSGDHHQRAALASRAREQAVRKFRWQAIAAQYLNVFERRRVGPGLPGRPLLGSTEG
jgi:glycosyltransferase involved in cell wall biosynthesis